MSATVTYHGGKGEVSTVEELDAFLMKARGVNGSETPMNRGVG
jgi:hypothetical protein